MTHLNVLLVSYHFPPSSTIGATTVGGLVRGLSKVDLRVTVVTSVDGANGHGSFEVVAIRDPLKSRRPTKTRHARSNDDAKDLRFGKVLSRARGIARSLLLGEREAFWSMRSIMPSIRLLKRKNFDFLIVSGPPHSTVLAGLIASKLTGTKFIPWFRDAWSGNPYYSRGFFARHVDKVLERVSLKLSTGLICSTAGLSELYERRYPFIRVCTAQSGVNEKLILESECSAESEDLVLTHTGSIYPEKRDPLTLFRGLSTLPVEVQKKLVVKFVGLDAGRDYVRARAASLWPTPLFRIEFHPRVSHEQAINIQRVSDILLCFTWDNLFERSTVPGKMYEYMATGRPILLTGCLDGDAARLLDGSTNCLVSNDAETIGEFVRLLYLRRRRAESTRAIHKLIPTKQNQALEVHAYLHRLLRSESAGGTGDKR